MESMKPKQLLLWICLANLQTMMQLSQFVRNMDYFFWKMEHKALEAKLEEERHVLLEIFQPQVSSQQNL